jgi:hypothetical protein
MKIWLLALLLLGCNHEAQTSPTDAAFDLTGVRECGSGRIGVACPGHASGCPRKAWCDTSGVTAECRCGDQSVNVGGDCVCSDGDDPLHPGCGATGFAGCP